MTPNVNLHSFSILCRYYISLMIHLMLSDINKQHLSIGLGTLPCVTVK